MPTEPRWVYLGGKLVPRAEAHLDIEDRGVLFADGVYEVLRYYAGRPLATQRHVDRLARGLGALGIPITPAIDALPAMSDELVRRNAMPDAKLYWQVTRGVHHREHAAPISGLQPTVLAMAYPAPPLEAPGAIKSLKVITREDPRWNRCDIKTLMLLPAVLLTHEARDLGADTVIMHRAGSVTEAAAANVAIVTRGELITHPADQWILPGITRDLLLELAPQAGIRVHERPFSLDELRAADEIIITGTTTHVSAVSVLDGEPVRGRVPGPMTSMLHGLLVDHIRQACGL